MQKSMRNLLGPILKVDSKALRKELKYDDRLELLSRANKVRYIEKVWIAGGHMKRLTVQR